MIDSFFAFLISVGPIGLLLGLFFSSIIANASLFLPLPIDLLIIPLATIDFFGLGIFTPFLLGLVVGLGASIGEFSGYFVGLAGVKSFESMKKQEVEKLKLLKDKLEIVGIPLIAFFAFTPLPFDLIGVAAGLAKYSKKKFFVGCLIGKVPRYLILAYAGYFGISFLIHLFGG
ncbi:MAG: VTT domain-containing protein [Candidatus ainarchaeum sp.]|nr:VTT domain-containing protein [Candidatus ainarchaeum sp.]